MVNRTLFNTTKNYQKYNTKNAAGGDAYSTSDAEQLCQYVVAGTFGSSYYTGAKEQLEKVKSLVENVDSELVAKAAVYAREQAKMKDTPAYLLAVLVARNEHELLDKVFFRVVDRVKMLCTFVQIVRSGVTGRKSFGSHTKRLIQQWLNNKSPYALFAASIGQANPSLSDIVKMVHPRPVDVEHEHMYGYLIGKSYEFSVLPESVQLFELFKKGATKVLPDVPFRALTNLPLTTENWRQIGMSMPWNTLRMNLNLLNRHGVFSDREFTSYVVKKLRSKEEVVRSMVLPYNIMTSYKYATDVPVAVRNALQDALDYSVDSVPDVDGGAAVCVDLSGSMTSPVTGYRAGSTSVVMCSDVAGMLAAVFSKKNDSSSVYGFGDRCAKISYNSRDSLMTNAGKFSRNPGVGHGTSIPSALRKLNDDKATNKLVVIVTDCMSWHGYSWYATNTNSVDEWNKYRRRVRGAKLAYINVQHHGEVQNLDAQDVINIGGFSDSVFDVMANFVNHGGNGNHMVDVVRNISL